MQEYVASASTHYEIQGIAAHLAAIKLASESPMDIATLSCDLLDFTAADIDAAVAKWRATNQGPSLVVDFHDPTNVQHRQMLFTMAMFNMGSLAWRMLESVEETRGEGLAIALGAALRVELRNESIATGQEKDSLESGMYPMLLRQVGRLEEVCDYDGAFLMLVGPDDAASLEEEPNPCPRILKRVRRFIQVSEQKAKKRVVSRP